MQCAGVTANLEAGALCKTAVSNVCCVNILNAMISRLVTTVGADTFTFMLIRHIINMTVLHPVVVVVVVVVGTVEVGVGRTSVNKYGN